MLLIQTVDKYQNIKNSYNSTIKEKLSNLKMGKISKSDMKLANKHMERCSTSLVIRELQIKTIRYFYISIRISKTKNINSQVLVRCGTIGSLTTFL